MNFLRRKNSLTLNRFFINLVFKYKKNGNCKIHKLNLLKSLQKIIFNRNYKPTNINENFKKFTTGKVK